MTKKNVNQEVVTVQGKEVTVSGAPVLSTSLGSNKFKVDFMSAGTQLAIDSTGKFISKEDDSVVFDGMDAVILEAKPTYTLWGKEGDEKEDELIISADSADEAFSKFDALCEEDPDFAANYQESDIKERLLITFQNIEDEQLYMLNLSPTSKWSFGGYYKKLVQGRYKTQGADRGTEPHTVVTKIGTEGRTKGKLKWTAVTFDFVSILGAK